MAEMKKEYERYNLIVQAGWDSFTSFSYNFVQGAIDVLPEESFLKNCRDNVTEIVD